MFNDYIKIFCWWGLVEDVNFLVIGILEDTGKYFQPSAAYKGPNVIRNLSTM
jgi:hypothetical protein